jgi:flagellar M-ring protein FliF
MLNALKNMPMKSRLMLGGSVLGVIIVAYMLMSLAGKPSYTMLAAGIDPAQTGKITATLDAQGISYQLANNGTALEVVSSDVAKARVALATAGVSTTGGQDPFATLDKQKMGASQFQQQVAYQRALEQQIAQTVDQISGVSGATVQLTQPQEQLFADQQTPATAAVLLNGTADQLNPGAVRGIANLVASSVQNLKTSNVTITDSSGAMLWPSGDAANGGVASKPAAEARYNSQLASQLNAIVERTVGPGKASVQVQSDLNVDATTQDKLQYAKTGVALHKVTDNETLKGSGSGASGVGGTGSNIPSYSGAGGSGGNSNYSHKQGTTDYGVSKVVSHTKVAPGAVNKLDVALVIDPSVPAATRTQLQKAIATAAGITPARGDTISTSVVPFAKVTTPKAGPIPTGMLGYAKYAALGLATLLFLFFVSRHLRRREEGDLIGEPVWLRTIEAPRPVGQLAGSSADQATAMLQLPGGPRRQVEDVVKRSPERAAQTLRAWMETDR